MATEPPAAAALFGDRIDLARRYVELLAGPGIERGLIGPREAGRLWDRHLLNCAVLGALLPAGARVVDIGSGAGLPGIPLALARPDCRIDLVEPLLRRSTFLDEVVADLALTGCRVIRARAEDAIDAAGGADVVTARAVAPLAKLARWAAPLLRPGGMMLILKGASAADEVARDGAAARAVGLVDLSVLSVGGEVVEEPATVVSARLAGGRRARPSGPRRQGRSGRPVPGRSGRRSV
jgi:16S rRNA (guanine527-N7)-methyltransferase